MLESYLKTKIKKDLLEKAWYYSPVQMGRGASGIPDIIACMPTVIRQEDVGKTLGLFVGIEAKVGSNKPTPLQTRQLQEIAKAGGMALVITGQDKKPYVIDRVHERLPNNR